MFLSSDAPKGTLGQLALCSRADVERVVATRFQARDAMETVALLRARGFRARRLEDGFPESRAASLPTAEAA
jgi:hypothetical protein